MSVLKLEKREYLNSLQLNQLRKDGFVPGVIYGVGLSEDGSGLNFSISYIDLEKKMREGCFFNTLIHVELDGKKYTVLPRAAQSHVVTDRILHIELQKVEMDQQVQVNIPFLVTGTELSETIKRGAAVHLVYKGLKIRCKAGSIPKAVKLNVADLKIGGMIKIKDLKLPSEMKVLHENHLTILKITGKKSKQTESTEEVA